MKKTVNTSQIVVNPDLLARNKVNEAAVASYLELFQDGVEFPPITLFNIDGDLILASGLHRLEVYKHAKCDDIPATIIEGTLSDLKLHSIQSNTTHGLQYTNEEKRRCVALVLSEKVWKDWADNHIAKMCGVSNHFVKKVRCDLGIQKGSGEVVYEKNGVKYKMQTKKIGPTPSLDLTITNTALNSPESTPTKAAPQQSLQTLLNRKSIDMVLILKTYRASYDQKDVKIPADLHEEIVAFLEWFQSLNQEEA